jgi:nucleolar protein 9
MQWCTAKKGICESEIAAFLFEAFHTKSTSEKKSLVPLILRLQAFESLDLAKPVQALGCTLLAAIPSALCEATLKPFVDSLLDFSSQDLVNLSLNPQGSRAIEAFLIASSVSETANRRLVRKLTGHFAQLAVDKFGSHVVERCWAMSKVDLKNAVMEELLTAKTKLQDSQHGRMVWKNCKVEQFERRQADWVKEEAAAERKKSYFADILGEDGGDVPAKTKKEKSKSKKKSKKNAEDDDSLLLTEDQPSSKKCKLLQ